MVYISTKLLWSESSSWMRATTINATTSSLLNALIVLKKQKLLRTGKKWFFVPFFPKWKQQLLVFFSILTTNFVENLRDWLARSIRSPKFSKKRTHWYHSVGNHVEVVLVPPWVTNSKKRRFSNFSTYPHNCQKRIIFLSILYFFSTWISSIFQKSKILISGFIKWLSVNSAFCITHAGFALVPLLVKVPVPVPRSTVPCTCTCSTFTKQWTTRIINLHGLVTVLVLHSKNQ